MNYFIINNTFQLYDAKKLADEIGAEKCILIQIPYSLTPVENDSSFTKCYILQRCEYIGNLHHCSSKRFVKILYDNNKNKNQIDIISPNKADVLFVFTECELMNQLLVKKFYDLNASVYLIEDGIASYIYYRTPSDALNLRLQIVKYVFRLLYGLKGFFPYIVDNYIYSMMSDTYFKGICYFSNITIIRKIPTLFLKKNELPINDLNPNSAIFLTQPIYQTNTTEENHLKTVEICLSHIANSFEQVYVKCHPAEYQNGFYKAVKSLTLNHSNVSFIDQGDIVEVVIDKYAVGYSISLFSSTLNKLAYRGLEPIYLYKFFDYLKNAHDDITQYLEAISCKTPDTWNDVKPGFKSGIVDKVNRGISITELI